MLEELRCWLARKLCPDVFKRADRGWQLDKLVSDLHRWCGEFPDIDAATTWIYACLSSHYRKAGEPAHVKAMRIDDFREMLRRRATRPDEIV